MSFASEIKKELCHLPLETACCARAELAGICALCGTLLSESDGGGLRLRTENAAVATRAHGLISELYGISTRRMSVRKKTEGYIYTLHIPAGESFTRLAKALGFLQDDRVKFCADPFITADSCCRRSFLRGAFLGSGSASAQNSYHFEIETHYHDLARDILQLFRDEEILARTVMRKSSHVIYIKDSEEIADALAALGATDAALELYSIKIEKDMKNQVNRRVNCENANMTKTANTAAAQIVAINKVLASPMAADLTEGVLELAHLRLQNPEASLSELADMMEKPISKSGVSRRLQKIIDLAETL